MIRTLTVLFALLGVAVTGSTQQTIVFPAVVDEVPGQHESLWVSIARIIKTTPGETVTVRRKWVCLRNGGFLEDPADAPSWILTGSGHYAEDERILFKWGDALLAGTDTTAGAVAFEIEGGEVIAHTIAQDVTKGYDAPGSYSFGQGQFIRGLETPIVGPSHIPYLGGCLNSPCSFNPPVEWDYLRNNIGLVNPNPGWLTFKGTVVPFTGHGGSPGEIKYPEPETFEKSVPPYGWLQFRWASSQYYGSGPSGVYIYPTAGFVISLAPDKDLPYYAYASVVFTPDPDSDNQAFNDPMFVPAEPGYVAPFAEVFPPKGDEE